MRPCVRERRVSASVDLNGFRRRTGRFVIVTLCAATFGACAAHQDTRRTPPPSNSKRCPGTSLPSNAGALIKLADKIVENRQAGERALHRARLALIKALRDPRSRDAARRFDVRWRLARVFFRLAHLQRTESKIVSFALYGQTHARQAMGIRPKRVEPHYYLALNLAKVAEAKRQLALITSLVKVAEKAEAIDPTIDHGGPLVILGKVYLEAPAWPVSVGNIEKAVSYLERAVQVAPIAQNRIFLGQAYYEDDQPKLAERELRAALRQVGQGAVVEARWLTLAKKTYEKLK